MLETISPIRTVLEYLVRRKLATLYFVTSYEQRLMSLPTKYECATVINECLMLVIWTKITSKYIEDVEQYPNLYILNLYGMLLLYY